MSAHTRPRNWICCRYQNPQLVSCQVLIWLPPSAPLDPFLFSLLESGCTDPSLDVQEAALGAMRRVLEMEPGLKKVTLHFYRTFTLFWLKSAVTILLINCQGFLQRLMVQYNSVTQQIQRPGLLKRLLVNRNHSQTPASAAQASSSLIQESILTHLSALCTSEKTL